MSIPCDECEKATAIWHCGECTQSLCGICDANIHAKGARKSHKRTPFAQPTIRAVVPDVTAVKMKMPTQPATVAQASLLPNTRAGDRTSAYMFEDPEAENRNLLAQVDFINQDLQQDMNNIGGEEILKVCPGCNMRIEKESRYMSALGRRFHDYCFKCAHCNKPFNESSFVEQDGKAYCPADHKLLFSNKCFQCGGYVKDRIVRALGRTYHQEHFTCAKCNTPLSNNFAENNGKVYCTADYAELFGSKCPICSKAIFGPYIDTNGKRIHQECFCCTTCKISLLTTKAFSHSGQPYCETHFHKLNNSVCATCSKPVVGRAVSVGGKVLHPECFRCVVCFTQLTGNFFEVKGKPYCEIHKNGK